ncbi:hypothetical protein BKA03_001769 [Demequina lutea]|uniref:Uncharacterized protein n=1 Tax=Demequina lutea TaxID=431489 RepID=A0A7Y9ZCU7_9MICO|nr:hypothetical protein [Demequina lutea]
MALAADRSDRVEESVLGDEPRAARRVAITRRD